jgi:hypothetical protein
MVVAREKIDDDGRAETRGSTGACCMPVSMYVGRCRVCVALTDRTVTVDPLQSNDRLCRLSLIRFVPRSPPPLTAPHAAAHRQS